MKLAVAISSDLVKNWDMLRLASSNQGDSVNMRYDADGQLMLRNENGGVKRTVILGEYGAPDLLTTFR